MLIKTKGLVFKAHKYGETSVIAEIYTEARGVQRYIISGVRSKNARTHANLLQPMSQLELVAYAREDKDLNRVKELRPALVYAAIPFEVIRGTIGLFMIEVSRKAIRSSEPDPDLYAFLEDCFVLLDQTSQPLANFPLLFLCQLSAHLGFCPDGHACADTPLFDLRAGSFLAADAASSYALNEGQSAILSQILEGNPSQVLSLPIPKEQRRLLLSRMLDFYRLHLDYFPEIHSHQILAEVLY